MLKVMKTRDVRYPERSGRNAGFDFFVPNDIDCDPVLKGFMINPGDCCNIPSGIKVRLPKNHCLIAFNKSGIAVNTKLIVGACVVDENYTGEIHLNMINVGKQPILITPGMKLSQFVLIKQAYHEICVHQTEETLYEGFDKKERGSKGFGSSGI
tara:strand:- start:9108 stop:9569 length:462 start_codon:yes stop_codon:yes gene_type:complete